MGLARPSVFAIPAPTVVFTAVLAAVLTVGTAGAQDDGRGYLVPDANNVLVAIAAGPGVGVEASYVAPGRMYTREATLLADISRFDSAGSSQVAVTIGGSWRIVGSLETLGMARPRRFDVHLGVRVGPGLLFRFNEERADRNQRFNLVFEPFIRYTLRGRRLLFAEAGLSRPKLRIGIKL